MTTKQTLRELKKAGKSIGVTRLYQLFDLLYIRPIAARQRPQQYPEDSAERILKHFGITKDPQQALPGFNNPKQKGK